MLSNWFFLTTVAGLSSNLFNTLLRRTLRDGYDATAYAWWFELFRSLVFLVLLLWDYSFVYSPSHLFWLFTLGLVEVVAVYTYMKMHATTELSVSSVIMRLRSIWVVVLAYMFLDERLTSLQYLGIFTVIFGALLLNHTRRLRTDSAVRNVLLFTLSSAISTVIIKHASTFASVSVINFAFSFPSVILIPILMRSSLSRLHSHLPLLGSTLLVTFFNSLTMIALVAALKLGNASQVTGIFQAVTMLAVVIGIFFLHERDHKWSKLLAGTVTLLGMLLLT